MKLVSSRSVRHCSPVADGGLAWYRLMRLDVVGGRKHVMHRGDLGTRELPQPTFPILQAAAAYVFASIWYLTRESYL